MRIHMKTSVEDDSIVASRLYIIQRLLKKLPASGLKRKALYHFRKFMKKYNVRYHNLPSAFPNDFKFERWIHTFNKTLKTTSSIIIGNNEVTCSKKIFKLVKTSADQNSIYNLVEEQSGSAEITGSDSKKLYALLRDVGFLHFELEEIDVSFDAHSTSSYQLTAHGKRYSFVNATESPIQPMWEQNCEELDGFLNKIAGNCNVTANGNSNTSNVI